MDYFYAPRGKFSGDSVVIDGEEFAHMTHVMRKKEGDDIRVVDGLGTAFDVRLGHVGRDAVAGKVLGKIDRYNEPEREVTLAVGILKNPSRFDFLVEKATELGVRRIIPLMTSRTIPSHAKAGRWRKLALAAMKQSGRSWLPSVDDLMTLDELLTQRDLFPVRLIAHEEQRHSVDSGNPGVAAGHQTEGPTASAGHHTPPSAGHQAGVHGESSASTIILIGPEGGFSEEEVIRCEGAGFIPVWLGGRRLRTETAAVVMAARVLLA